MVEGAAQIDRANELNNLLELAGSVSLDGNWQEAYGYATRALELDPKSSWAWQLKGDAAGQLSTLADMRLSEVIGAFKRSIELSAPSIDADAGLREASLRGQSAQRELCGSRLTSISQSLYYLSRDHLSQFGAVPGTAKDHWHRCEAIVSALEVAYEWCRGESNYTFPLEFIVDIVDDLTVEPTAAGYLDRTTPSPFTSAKLTAARESAVKTLSLNPGYTDPRASANSDSGSKKSTACFVVTATMGDESALPVVTLREFRDVILTRSTRGRAFNAWYYEHGPGIADWIRPSRFLRAVSFTFIVMPATVVAKLILAMGR